MSFQALSQPDGSTHTKKFTVMLEFFATTKGQLISKANCQAIDSPKKRTNGV